MTIPGQARNLFPALRVFIYGVEVTEDISTCVVNLHDGRAPNTAEFTLANKFDKYTMTELDLRAVYNDLAAQQVVNEFNLDLLNLALPEQVVSSISNQLDSAFLPNSIKGRILASKIGIRQTVNQASIADQAAAPLRGPPPPPVDNIPALKGDAPRYPFMLGKPVFHSNDAVRIFMRDLEDPTVWYYAFTGFITGYSLANRPTGESTITFRCEDVLRIFRYSRIAINPSIFDIAASKTSQDTEFQSFFKDGFQGLTLEQVLAILIFGSTATGLNGAIGVSVETGQQTTVAGAALPGYARIGVNGSTNSPSVSNGIGAFNFPDSRIYVFGPSTATDQPIGNQIGGVAVESVPGLAQYQAQVDHRVFTDDLATLLSPDADQTAVGALIASVTPVPGATNIVPIGQAGSYPQITDVITLIGTHPEYWPVDYGRLTMLIPSTLGNGVSSAILTQDLIDSFALQTKFTTRLALIYNFVNRIEFSFYATPRGDLVLEMPLYDFDPDDFGDTPFQFTPVGTVSGGAVPITEKRGGYSSRYTFSNRDIFGWDEGFDDEKIRTQFRASYLLVAGTGQLGTQEQVGYPPAVAQLDALIPLFGVRSEDVDPYGYIASPQAAKTYANLKLNQWNSDAQSAKIEVVPRLGVGPNRPLKFLITTTGAPDAPLRYGHIATSRTITNSIVWGSSVEGSFGMNYMRNWDGQLTSDNRRVFSPLGGFASRPLNYNLIFNSVLTPNTGTGAKATSTQNPVNGASAGSVNASSAPQMSYKSLTQQSTSSSDAALTTAQRIAAARGVATDIKTLLYTNGISSRITGVSSSAARDKGIRDRAATNPTQVNLEALKALTSGNDPHAAGRAFDIQGAGGSSNDDIFHFLVDPNSIRRSEDRSEIVGEPANPGLFPGGAKIILETQNNHVHVQWTDTSHKQGFTSNP